MSRTPDSRIKQAKAMFDSGSKLKEIASALEVSEGTVRSWKNRYKWDSDSNATLRKTLQKSVAIESSVAKEKKNKSEAVENELDLVLENTDLTSKQQLFCCLYIKCFNATKAYQKAYGCAYSTALTNGPALLRNARIKEEIRRLKKNRLNREFLDESDIFQKYMDIAFADITDYVAFGRETVPVMGPFGPIVAEDKSTGEKVEVTKEINVVQFKESLEVDGTLITEVRQGKDGVSIKLLDKLKALDWLADHMDMATTEQKAKIKKLEAESERIRRETTPEDDGGVVIVNDVPKTGTDIKDNHSEVSDNIQ